MPEWGGASCMKSTAWTPCSIGEGFELEEDLGFVIGRLSDFDIIKNISWTLVRKFLAKGADSDPNFVLVNTNDLNDGLSRKGKEIKDDLHYSKKDIKFWAIARHCPL